jgi:hypothetical protein
MLRGGIDFVNRYAPTFRRDELTLVCDLARKGHSLCFVGVAGSGKSNITNFLRHDPYGYKHELLGQETGRILFPRIDGNSWQRTPQSLWSLMLVDLENLAEQFSPPAADPKVLAISDEQRLNRLAAWLCQSQKLRVMFILDDFDEVLQVGPLSMLDRLAALRNDGNRDMLGYLIFTKKLPHILGRDHPLLGKSKFYDLFKNDIYALSPYSDADARHMLDFLNHQDSDRLNGSALANIQYLAGGHAGLLKTLYELWKRERPSFDESIQLFSSMPEVNNECARIVQNLHEQEQEAALRVARGQVRPDDAATISHLMTRGLLRSAARNEWFSPLMETFLRRQAYQGGAES